MFLITKNCLSFDLKTPEETCDFFILFYHEVSTKYLEEARQHDRKETMYYLEGIINILFLETSNYRGGTVSCFQDNIVCCLKTMYRGLNIKSNILNA